MSKTIKEERLRWVVPIYQKQIKLVDAVKVCPYSQRSLERWLSAYRRYSEAGPAQNGKVERSHRTDQEMFYERNRFKTLKELETKIKNWNTQYNNLEHCGLNGKTPNEMLQLLTN